MSEYQNDIINDDTLSLAEKKDAISEALKDVMKKIEENRREMDLLMGVLKVTPVNGRFSGPGGPLRRDQDIIQWGIDRDIYTESTPMGQWAKLLEETGELAEAIHANDFSEVQDAIGDILVCAVHVARFYNTTLSECLEQAWQEIKDRKGRMIGGKFVKEEDADTEGERRAE